MLSETITFEPLGTSKNLAKLALEVDLNKGSNSKIEKETFQSKNPPT